MIFYRGIWSAVHSQLGFFAEAGPLNIFVSRVVCSCLLFVTSRRGWLCDPAFKLFFLQNIPGDMNLRQDGNAWVSGSGDEIKAETDVRLKILSASVQVTHLVRSSGAVDWHAVAA
jgi:hypothetical protein